MPSNNYSYNNTAASTQTSSIKSSTSESIKNIKEYLLTTDEFKNPKVVNGTVAIGILLLRLLLAEHGHNPLHPDMGVGLGPKYRFILESQMGQLQDRITNQLHTYLPSEFMTVTDVEMAINKDKYLCIRIIVNDQTYVYDTQESETPIQLSDLINDGGYSSIYDNNYSINYENDRSTMFT